MMSHNDIRDRLIPYRLWGVSMLSQALRWSYEWEPPREIRIAIENGPTLRGNTNLLVNPLLEAGMVHARALLEFLGLKQKDGRLVQVDRRYRGDIAVEHFAVNGVPLQKVKPLQALSMYQGPQEEAEEALVSVIELANKGFAHVTDFVASRQYNSKHIEDACRGIPALVEQFFYTPLGLPLPETPSAAPELGR